MPFIKLSEVANRFVTDQRDSKVVVPLDFFWAVEVGKCPGAVGSKFTPHFTFGSACWVDASDNRL